MPEGSEADTTLEPRAFELYVEPRGWISCHFSYEIDHLKRGHRGISTFITGFGSGTLNGLLNGLPKKYGIFVHMASNLMTIGSGVKYKN